MKSMKIVRIICAMIMFIAFLAPGTGTVLAKSGELDVLKAESIGPLAYGMDEPAIKKAIGNPETVENLAPEPGGPDVIWKYPKKGITLYLVKTKKGTLAIDALAITAPSAFKTKRNIGIGSTYQNVMDAYKEYNTPASSSGGFIVGRNRIVIMGGEGALTFIFKDGKISEISIAHTQG